MTPNTQNNKNDNVGQEKINEYIHSILSLGMIIHKTHKFSKKSGNQSQIFGNQTLIRLGHLLVTLINKWSFG